MIIISDFMDKKLLLNSITAHFSLSPETSVAGPPQAKRTRGFGIVEISFNTHEAREALQLYFNLIFIARLAQIVHFISE